MLKFNQIELEKDIKRTSTPGAIPMEGRLWRISYDASSSFFFPDFINALMSTPYVITVHCMFNPFARSYTYYSMRKIDPENTYGIAMVVP